MERRTLSEIYDALALEKANMDELKDYYTHYWNDRSVLDDTQTLMEDLSSKSKVAIWRLLLWVVAVAIWVHEGLWFIFKSEVDTALNSQIAHTARWYQQESLKFQYGDELIWNSADGKYEYSVYDPDKQIIKQCSVVDDRGIVKLKVATYNSSQKLIPLDNGQMTAFEAFWKKFKDAGVILEVISVSPDLLHLAYDVRIDPTILKPDGSLISDSSVFPVEDAINNYIANLDFDGKFSLEECDAAIRSATGVTDLMRTMAQSKKYNGVYKDIEMSIISYAGYFAIDDNYPLSNTISYV